MFIAAEKRPVQAGGPPRIDSRVPRVDQGWFCLGHEQGE